MFNLLSAVLFTVIICAAPVAAQNNEISFSVGGGSLIGADDGRQIGADDSRGARAYTLAYARYLTERWALEGSAEDFSIKSRNVFDPHRESYVGLQASALYHILPASPDRRFVPYLTAGIGFTTPDPTEIPPVSVIRMGGGFKYFFGQSRMFGLRVEARNEIINDNRIFFPPQRINFPSARVGVVYRF
jgi:hypothetical protein